MFEGYGAVDCGGRWLRSANTPRCEVLLYCLILVTHKPAKIRKHSGRFFQSSCPLRGLPIATCLKQILCLQKQTVKQGGPNEVTKVLLKRLGAFVRHGTTTKTGSRPSLDETNKENNTKFCSKTILNNLKLLKRNHENASCPPFLYRKTTYGVYLVFPTKAPPLRWSAFQGAHPLAVALRVMLWQCLWFF